MHTRMYKSLAPAFSTKALVEQEEIIQSCVDDFLQVLDVDGTNPLGLNMTRWFEMLTFDVLGEMAFGESFDSLKNSRSPQNRSDSNEDELRILTEKKHPWEALVVDHIFWLTVLENLRRFRIFRYIGAMLLPRLFSVRNKHSQLSRDRVGR